MNTFIPHYEIGILNLIYQEICSLQTAKISNLVYYLNDVFELDCDNTLSSNQEHCGREGGN